MTAASLAARLAATSEDVEAAGRRIERIVTSLDHWHGAAADAARATTTAAAMHRRALVSAADGAVSALRVLAGELDEVAAIRHQAGAASDPVMAALLSAHAAEREDAAGRRAAVAIDAAATSLAPAVRPDRHHHHWWDRPAQWAGNAWHAVEGAGERALHVATTLGHHGDDIGQVALDALGTALGLALTAAGSGVETGGVALDATGVGAVAGVPLNIAGIAMMAAGGGLAAASGAEFGKDASRLTDEVGDDLQTAPEYDVQAHEGINDAHVLERHVGLTDDELVERLADPKIRGASTFSDTTSAQEWIQRALDRKWPDIESWLSGKGKGAEFKVRFDEPIGRAITRESWEGSGNVVPAHELTLVLQRTSEAPEGFVVRTVKIYP